MLSTRSRRTIFSSRFLQNFDYVLLFTTIILIIFGVMMIASATRGVDSLADRVNSQVLYGIVSIGVVFIIAALDYRLLTSTYLWI